MELSALELGQANHVLQKSNERRAILTSYMKINLIVHTKYYLNVTLFLVRYKLYKNYQLVTIYYYILRCDCYNSFNIFTKYFLLWLYNLCGGFLMVTWFTREGRRGAGHVSVFPEHPATLLPGARTLP